MNWTVLGYVHYKYTDKYLIIKNNQYKCLYNILKMKEEIFGVKPANSYGRKWPTTTGTGTDGQYKNLHPQLQQIRTMLVGVIWL